MPLHVIYGDATNDDSIQSDSVTYATARSGGGTKSLLSASSPTLLQVGQNTGYSVFQSLLGFDTAVVDNTVLSVQLNLWVPTGGDLSTTNFTIEVRQNDHGAGAPTTGDYIDGASLAGKTLLASASTVGLSENAYLNFTNNGSNFESAINLTGFTRFLLASDRTRLNTTPTTSESVFFSSGDASGTTQDPRLIISAPGPAVNGSATFTASAESLSVTVSNVVPTNPLPLEVRIYAAAAPTGAAIAVLEGQHGTSWEDAFNATGSGTLTLALADPKAVTANLAKYNLVRCFLGPFDVFQFWIELLSYTVASPQGEAGNAVVLSGRGLEAYLTRAIVWTGGATYTSVSVGFIMADLIATAQARGALSLLAVDFSAAADSAGVAWPTELASVVMTFTEGTDYLAVLEQLRQLGVMARLRRDFTLQMWGTDPWTTEATDVILRPGKHFAESVQWQRPYNGEASHLMAGGNPGISATLTTGLTLPDRFEGYVKGPATDDSATLVQVAVAESERRDAASHAIRVRVFHGLGPGEYEPYRHYLPGYTPKIVLPGYIDQDHLPDRLYERVAAIHVEAGEEGLYLLQLDLASIPLTSELAIAKQVALLSRP